MTIPLKIRSRLKTPLPRIQFWKTSTGKLYGLCLLWALLVAGAWQVGLTRLVRQELTTVDFRYRLRGQQPVAPEIILLTIDQRSLVADEFTPAELQANPQLAELASFPFPRRVYAAAIDRLIEAGAQVVGIDLLFLAPKDDEALQAALARHHRRVVLGSNFSDDGRQLMAPTPVLPPDLAVESLTGYVNYWPDPDGVVRRSKFKTTAAEIAGLVPSDREPVLASFDWQIAQRFQPTLPATGPYINFVGPTGSFPSYPFYELFFTKTWERNLQHGAVFRGKIVLIGPGGNFQHDQHPTPWGVMNGVEVHAAGIATQLHGNAPHDAANALGFLLIFGGALLGALVLNTGAHPLAKLGLLGAGCGGYFGVAQVLFARTGILLLVAAPVWTVVGAGVLGIALQVAIERLEKLRVRRTLEKYVSGPVAAEILRHSHEYENSLGGERKSVTILFSDIRDFTSISERSDPLVLVQQLNEYFTVMVDIVMKHNGTLDKYIGDAIMAVYGSPLSAGTVEDAWRAVQTAAEMRTGLIALQTTWAAQGRPVLRIGIGINHGDVVVGNIGSPQRMEYTVIGDAVNVASRVEGLNKQCGTDILLTESVYLLVKDRVVVKAMELAAVKGREQKLNVYALTSLGPVKT